MELYLITGLLALALSALYWFRFRDDGKWDSNASVNLAKIDYGHRSTVESSLAKKSQKKDGIPIRVIFYSQTGTAEDFAKRLAEEAENYGFAPDVIDAEEYEKENLESEKVVVFIVATYGEGDPPDNAADFHDWLTSEALDLSNTKFAVFGLGNRTYDKFNEIGKVIDARLEELGGRRVCELGEGDDDANIENDFLVWKKIFSQEVCKAFKLPPPEKLLNLVVKRKQRMQEHQPNESTVKATTEIDKIDRWRENKASTRRMIDAKTPHLATIVLTRELHKQGSDRSCLHVEIDTGNMLNYLPGDHLGVYAENDETEVHRLASKIIGAELNKIISVYDINDTQGRTPIVKAALQQYYDITSPARKQLCAILAQYAEDKKEKKRLLTLASGDPDEQAIYLEWIVKDLRTPYEVLKEFKSVKVPLDHFLEGLLKMQPRYYSISSSPNSHSNTVHLTAVVVDYITPTKRRAKGVVTSWLANHWADSSKGITHRIPVFIRRSTFKLPTTLDTPLIMVGPGTGLAPFRGFLHERRHLIGQMQRGTDRGESLLFFGCRYPDKDYIYEDELQSFSEDGTLSNLSVAFSRAQKEKHYVQHRMLEGDMPKRIWNTLSNGGYFYICGDAKNMARDVHAALVTIMCQEGGLTKEKAEAFISKMQSEAPTRYLSDVWS